jgi:formate hydrogenlyase transcriptional activator
MAPAQAKSKPDSWLMENGPVQLEALFQTIIFLAGDSDCRQSGCEAAPRRKHAFSLLDPAGNIVAWYPDSEEMYLLGAADSLGRHVSSLYEKPLASRPMVEAKLDRAITRKHSSLEAWHLKGDGTRFRGLSTVLALSDSNQQLRGFARIVLDVTRLYEKQQKLQRSAQKHSRKPVTSPTTCVACGGRLGLEQMNEPFLQLLGYSVQDLNSDAIPWFAMTPAEYGILDELAHLEALQHGASSPYEKELLHKDGTRTRVNITTAILQAVPLRWISFVHDLQHRAEEENLEEDLPTSGHDFGEVVGVSSALGRVQRQVEVVAPTDATVLILGETGTGKELVARAIHRLSPRHAMPFITLNCAAIPTGLLESELFGYERGAFTGAAAQKIGRFEMADRGTLFLDEVGDIPIDLQPKLLRALQEKSFERLGGKRTIPIDVRLIAATNRNLTQMMEDHLFRSDLYYRLKVFPIITPSLRDRPEDIPVLARHFTKKYSERMGRHIESIPADTMLALQTWPWPGNVRELENFIERSVILSSGPVLRAPLSEIRQAGKPAKGSALLENVEREHILKILRECDGVVTAAATRLGLHRTTLNAMLKKLGLTRRDF